MRRLSRFIARHPTFFGIMAVTSVILGLIFIFNTSNSSMGELGFENDDRTVQLEEGAESNGRDEEVSDPDGIELPYSSRYGDENQNFNQDMPHIIWNALILSVLAAVAMRLQPTMYLRASSAAQAATTETAIAGFITMGTATVLTFLYVILSALTLGLLCLALPLVGVAWGALTLALIAGWMVVGYPIGAEIVRRTEIKLSMPVIAAFGTGTLTVVHGLLEMLPVIGLLSTLMLVAVGSVGLGSLILTRFGRRHYPEVIELKRKNEAFFS